MISAPREPAPRPRRILDLSFAAREEGGEGDDEPDLRELGGLGREGAQVDPAARPVDGCAEEDGHERRDENGEPGADDGRIVEPPVVDEEREERQAEAEEDGDRLLDEEEVRKRGRTRSRQVDLHRGRAVDHQEAGRDEQNDRHEENPVGGELQGHVRPPPAGR